MADSGTAALEGEGLGSLSIPKTNEGDDNGSGASRLALPPLLTPNPPCTAQHETGQGHGLVGSSNNTEDDHDSSNRNSGNETVETWKPDTGLDLDRDLEGVESLSIHPGSVEHETCGAAAADAADASSPGGGPLHDEPASVSTSGSTTVPPYAIPGSSHSSDGCSGKGKAAAETETSTPPSDVLVSAGQLTQDTTTNVVDPDPLEASDFPSSSSIGSISDSSSVHRNSRGQQGKGKGRDLGIDYDPPPSSSSQPKSNILQHSPTDPQLPLPPTQPMPYQPPRAGDPGWERSADRPPKKLPIRFRDAVGRNFVFPWDKVKTWDVRLEAPFHFLFRLKPHCHHKQCLWCL